MAIDLKLDAVTDKATFLDFLVRLQGSLAREPDDWENHDLPDYLFAIERWTSAWKEFDTDNPWKMAATFLMIGQIYE